MYKDILLQAFCTHDSRVLCFSMANTQGCHLHSAQIRSIQQRFVGTRHILRWIRMPWNQTKRWFIDWISRNQKNWDQEVRMAGNFKSRSSVRCLWGSTYFGPWLNKRQKILVLSWFLYLITELFTVLRVDRENAIRHSRDFLTADTHSWKACLNSSYIPYPRTHAGYITVYTGIFGLSTTITPWNDTIKFFIRRQRSAWITLARIFTAYFQSCAYHSRRYGIKFGVCLTATLPAHNGHRNLL